MNISLAKNIIEELVKKGVSTFCLCPGGRAAPFVELLSQSQGLEVFSFFEERSSCFFALGRAKVSRKPVAIITTSGSAVAELLPGAIESHYSHIPLVFITSDRPAGYGKKGSPQTLKDAQEILQPYVFQSLNIPKQNLLSIQAWQASKGSLHINASFDTPLLDEKTPRVSFSCPTTTRPPSQENLNFLEKYKLKNFLKKSSKPLVLVGELKPEELPFVKKFLKQTSLPWYAEPLSQLDTLDNRLISGENILSYCLHQEKIDSLIRIGGIPRTSFFRKLEKYSLPLLNLTSAPHYPGIYRKSLTLPLLTSLDSSSKHLSQNPCSQEIFEKDQEMSLKLLEILKKYPQSELAWLHKIQQTLPNKSQVFLGNSLPIRVWDLVSLSKNRNYSILGQGGVNGIDGLVSHFFGSCLPNQNNIGLVGDLSMLYDMSAFWISPKIPPWTLIVVNNYGGQIFSKLYNSPSFINSHKLDFSSLAKFWQVEYHVYTQVEDYKFSGNQASRLVEIRPNSKHTQVSFQSYDSIWSKFF